MAKTNKINWNTESKYTVNYKPEKMDKLLDQSDYSNDDAPFTTMDWTPYQQDSLPTLSSDNEHAGNYSLPMLNNLSNDNSSIWDRMRNSYSNFEDSADKFVKSNPITSFLAKAGQSAANVMTGGGALNDNYNTGSWLANDAANLVGTGIGFVEKLPGLGFSTGNILNKTIGKPAENALTEEVINRFGLNNKLPDLANSANNKYGKYVLNNLADYTTKALSNGAEFGAYNGLSNAIKTSQTMPTTQEVVVKEKDAPVTGQVIKFGPYQGQWMNDFNNDGGERRQLFKTIDGDSIYLSTNDDFTKWQDSDTFDKEIQAYKEAYQKAGGKQGYQQLYQDDSGYPDWVYKMMADKNFDAKAIKEWFNNNPKGIQWKQDSIPTDQRQISLGDQAKTIADSFVKGAGEGMGQGMLWGAGGKALGEVFSHFVPGIGKTKVLGEEGNNVIIQDEAGNKTPMNKVIFDNTSKEIPQPEVASTSEIPSPKEQSLNPQPFDMNLQTHSNPFNIDINAMSRRGDMNDKNLFEERTGRPAQEGDYKERQAVVNSFMNSDAIPQEVKSALAEDPTKYQYLEHNNEQAMMKARESVEKNFDGSVAKIRNLKALEDDADTALAIEVQRKYIENGEYDKARDWSLKVARLGTKSGQAIQYFSTIKRLTPQWTINRASKMIENSLTDKQKEILNNAPEDKVEEVAKKNNIPYLSEETTKKVADMSKEIESMPDGRPKREAIAKLNDTIQREIPVSILDKINSAQTLSMLSGTKTPIRNIIGNTLFKAVDNLKEIPRTIIDMPLALVTKERTATLPMIGDQFKGYKSGAKEAFLDLKNDVNTKDINDKFELNRRVTWDKNGNLINKAMHQAERVNRFALDDRPAMGSAYEGEMARQRKLAKINGTEFDEADAKEKANLKALHDTFNDDTAISQLLTNLKRNVNIAGNSILTGNVGKELDQATKDEFAKWGAGDLLVKFAKVPANIIARQVEYSPASLVTPFVKATRDAIKGSKFDQDAFADGLAKGLTGTGIMGLGAMLHNVMTTDSDKNKNKSELDKEAGLGSFKMNLSALQRLIGGGDTNTQKGDNIVSYDWANPISVLLAAGASMAKATDGKTVKGVGKIAGTLMDALNEGVNSVIEQPMNQGLKTWVQQGDMMGGLSQVMASLPQTFIPSLVNQFRQLSDNKSRETYDPNIFKQGLNQMVNRIPKLEEQLPQKVDIWGNPKETFQGGTNNGLNVFLNPAISTQYLPIPQTEKALSLFGHTANTEALPKLADRSIDVDNQKVKLTPDQFIQLQTLLGQGATDIYNRILDDNNSNKLAKDTAKALSDNSQDAKIKVLQDNNLPLPLSVTKDELSKDLYKKRSAESKTIRADIKSINDSDMTIEEKKKAMEDLRSKAQNAAAKNPPKPRGKKSNKLNLN